MNTNQKNEIILRDISPDDFHKGYMNLLFQFTNYEYSTTVEQFNEYLERMKNNCRILIISNGDKIIGAGTIFILEKIHNKPVGQIEDVIIDENHRKQGLGKLLIQQLVDIAISEYKCYKVILNASDNNADFYKACGFQRVSNGFKYCKNNV